MLMKPKSLFLMCGTPGSGKSTWIKSQTENMKYPYAIVSRDAIRFSMVNEDEEYFSKEDAVFEEFIKQIRSALAICDVVFADATHLTEKSRNKTLDRLNLKDVDVYPVNFDLPESVCLDQNENRKGTRAYVPRSAIRRMHTQYVAPTDGEKHKYKDILTITIKED